MKTAFTLCLMLTSTPLLALEKEARTMPAGGMDKALMGQILFFDDRLSFHGNQNCASCHSPDTAFVDLRETSAQQMVSQGDDPSKFGRRNSPTMLYAKFAPDFHFDEVAQEYVGGQFWDGRAKNLAQQSGMPPLDPLEMGMPNQLEVAKRLYSLPMYRQLFTQFYGQEVWQSYEGVYAAMEDALATFQTEKRLLAPFDSKYDKVLEGKASLTALEEKGRELFFDKSKTSCSNCHQSQGEKEIFTDFRYHNLQVPRNLFVIEHNGLPADFEDLGLAENPHIKPEHQQAAKYKFKTPTLRNVAVTAPYMHNGIFRELRTVIEYIDHFNNPARALNPETGKPWEKLPFAENLPQEKLKARALTDEDIEALEAFLKTLTDERYEPLLKD
ncbi:methylamine utilization protein MauG [Pasteurellaceae bacterium RH1A]|nr:methylamine utilization protein MauG [Pasteurellaceae bacterium RH1A]